MDQIPENRDGATTPRTATSSATTVPQNVDEAKQ